MIPPPFAYHRATSLADATAALTAAGEDARPLAGGQSLVALLKLRLAHPSLLVDLAGVPGLAAIERDAAVVSVGAMATHEAVGRALGAPGGHASFADVARQLGDPQVRAWGTLAGSLAHADPAGDWLPVAVAHEAVVRISGPRGDRAEPVASFARSAYVTSLAAGEVIRAVDVPVAGPAEASAYVKLPDPASGFARAGAAAVVRADGGRVAAARVALCGVAPLPTRLPTVEAALVAGDTPAAAAALCVDDVDVAAAVPDRRYRLQLARVAVRRSVERALGRTASRAGGNRR